MKKFNTMLVTCAFPYSNGEIHLGHLLEQIQADIWVRYYRMRGRSVIFICSDDTHGTAIMLKAKKMKISPKQLIHCMQKKHKNSFLQFSVVHDHYSSTNSQTNKDICEHVYHIIKKKKLIKEKTIDQLYDTKMHMFLSDRFIKGTCPRCKSINQYGDNCDFCGATYNAIELLNPISVLSHSSPDIKNSKHLFFKLSKFSEFLKKWINSGVIQTSVLNKINEWLSIGLHSWNISRDKPYFGFQIPGYSDKFFYVWMDAPIGYISCFKELCDIKKTINFNEFWSIQSKHELFHFIGKDIIYFHSLFWPAILEAYNYRKPTKIFTHGYVTFKGLKLSKSQGSIISASKWLSYFDSDSLRYYFASRLSNTIEDIDINLYDYAYKINADIVNNIINLASRNSSFLKKYFFNILSNNIKKVDLYQKFIDETIHIQDLFEERKFSLVIQKIRYLSDIANKYISKQKPWLLIKNIDNYDKVHDLCSLGINLFRILMIFLKPIMPKLVYKSELFLNTSLLWNEINQPLLNHKINDFSCLYTRIKICCLDSFLI
ncbi:Methionine--tRNA ligase [Buchnera aphidicola (Cinara piceae)]|uniref:Methionine--tRNA ligase n=1 Tax=Buchnera aphidicola (Cinara piceae) TaxID=1660043 RepID=A0A803FTF1_9GAMM|nr:methionine--tRNA ligase [Buchnera aphidicola]VFP87956.1 Methionine--tRNA ligase [Buchnera aphidicola (Cinara piceae)]